MVLFLLLLGLALGAASPSGGPEVKLLHKFCERFWYGFNSHCYLYVATPMSWIDAELYCVSQGGNLVSLHNHEEQQFVKYLISMYDLVGKHHWIGLSDIHKEGAWTWSDGSPVDFVRWDEEQPNDSEGRENCVLSNFGASGGWNDDQCSNAHASVCKSIVPCYTK